MRLYLRILAVCTVLAEVAVALFTIPQFHLVTVLQGNPLAQNALTLTGTLLALVAGALALGIALQCRQRGWSIAFVCLLLLGAYSPLLRVWVLMSDTFIYSAPRFYINQPAFFLINLSNQIVPAIVLAIVVFIYSLRPSEAAKAIR